MTSRLRSVVAGLALVLAACPASNEPVLDQPCVPGAAACPRTCDQFKRTGEFDLCFQTSDAGYTVVARYAGAGELALGATELRVAGAELDPASVYDAATRTFTLEATDLAPGKYSVLVRAATTAGQAVRPLFVPMWIGAGGYADFTWRDASMYQILTDRFLDGDPANNLDNSVGDLARVDDARSRWQGGDFAGITAKLREGYFEELGVNTLWISSPIINSHNSQPSVGLADPRRFASYHSYHPIATGYTATEHLGFATPIEPAFGTAAELHELVREAHLRGIRIIPDFVANHVQREAPLYAQHPDWFFPYNACDDRWDVARIGCWFTTDMPDFDYGGHPDAVRAVVDHALWMIQEFDFDGFRADALKHMDDVFVRELKRAVVAEIETTVVDHDVTVEPTVFYMVGESLGGWARYHVRADMVQGQVDEGYYNQTKAALLTFDASVRDLANFAIPNDTAYLTPQDTNGGRGGFPGAVMGNFFGNHDQVRALTEARQRGGGHERLRLALTFLYTSPGNIPMLYQGDDIGTEGGPDPDNRKMQRFTGLSTEEQLTLAHARAAGTLRAQHPALRRGTRTTLVLEDWYWVYQVTDGTDTVYVAVNRDNPKLWTPPPGFVDGLGTCSGGVVPVLSSCIFVRP
ncbi:MAG: alpha-amylase family glycosyl hydrolase [Kofleriaceae bacterium]